MASWKKIIVSGSDAELNSLYSSGNISSSGSLFLPKVGATVEIYNTVFEDDGGIFSINTNSTPELNLISPLITLDNSGGGNDLVVSGSNVGIGTSTPSETLTVEGNISASGLIYAPNIGTGTDNSVVILDSDGRLKTDEIDSRVWGSSLVDGSGGVNQFAFWSGSTGTSQTLTEGFLVQGPDRVVSASFDMYVGDELFVVTRVNAPNIGDEDGSTNFTGSFSGDGSGLTGVATELTVVDKGGNPQTVDLKTGTLQITATDALFTVTGSAAAGSSVIDVRANDASETQKGVATFDGTNFTVTGGDVTSNDITLTEGTGIDISTASFTLGESTTISVDVSDFMTNGDDNRIVTATGTDAMNAEANLTFDGSLLTVTGNATITGDLTVNGTTTTLDTQNVLVEDRFIFLNHGSGSVAPTSEGGIVVEGTTPDQGNAFYYDGNLGRWSLGESIAQDAISVTPSASMAAVVDVDGGQSDTETYQKNGNIKVESGEIWIYA